MIQGWLELAGPAANRRDRDVLAQLTLTFAELAGQLPVWKLALKEWNVQKSAYLDSIREEIRAEAHTAGRLEEVRALIVQLGREKFHKAPTKRQQQLADNTDLEHLKRIAARILEATSWSDLLATP